MPFVFYIFSMLAELKELTEWREKANENMKGLQKQLTAANQRGEQLQEELDTARKDRDRAVEKVLGGLVSKELRGFVY